MRSVQRVIGVVVILGLVACGGEERQSASTSGKPATTYRRMPHPVAAGMCDELPGGSQFPSRFDYPQSPQTVQGWVSSRSGPRERRHAYCLFAGLNQPADATGVPVWRTWRTASNAFLNENNDWPPQGGGNAKKSARPFTINQARSSAQGTPGKILNPPPLYPIADAVARKYPKCSQQLYDNEKPPKLIPNKFILKDGDVFQSNGDIMVAAVSYNNPAISNILDKQLYDANVLGKQLPSSPKAGSTTINTPMPSSSIVLKVMLWPVSGGSPGPAVTALPFWQWDQNPPGSGSDNQYAGYEMQQFWTGAVAISSGPVSGTPGTQRAQFLYGVLAPTATPSDLKPLGPNTYDNAQVVGLDRFYSKKFTDAEFKNLSDCDHALLDASAYWAYNRAFEIQDSLVLVAMHIMTKEPQSDWTFQSAWWHPDAQACPNQFRYCTGRPLSVPGGDTKWQNYMMTTTYGMQRHSGPVWPVAYNPYIELAASHPITTNCMNCHHRAAWPPDVPSKPVGQYPQSAYLQQSPEHPDPVDTFQSDNPIFNGQLMLDSMWAVSDRAEYPAVKPAKK